MDMPVVRVIVWDEETIGSRISSPEDTFLIEAIDASGSDENGHDDIHTFVSGVLSGNFITGTFHGDGSSLRGVVTDLNEFTGSINLVAGTNVTINSGSGEIVISASGGGGGADEKVKVSANDTTSDYLYNKTEEGLGIYLSESYDGSNEKLRISSHEHEEWHTASLYDGTELSTTSINDQFVLALSCSLSGTEYDFHWSAEIYAQDAKQSCHVEVWSGWPMTSGSYQISAIAATSIPGTDDEYYPAGSVYRFDYLSGSQVFNIVFHSSQNGKEVNIRRVSVGLHGILRE
jgi:hypothetical protein